MRAIIIALSFFIVAIAHAKELREPKWSEIREFRGKAFWSGETRLWFRRSFELIVIDEYFGLKPRSHHGLYLLNPPFVCITFGGPYECFVVLLVSDKPKSYMLRSAKRTLRLDAVRKKNTEQPLK